MKNQVNAKNLVDYIMEFEGGEISGENMLSLFSYLIKTGQCWTLQGFYGRTAKNLIENNLIDKKGVINWNRYNEIKEGV